MTYTIPYKGYVITLNNASVHVATPKSMGRTTIMYADATVLAAQYGDRYQLSIEDIYKAVDAKIEELAKQKIEDAIKANNSPRVRAVFIGQDGSMGFYKGQQYTLNVRFSPRQGYIIADPYRALSACPYESIQAILRNWSIM